MKIQFELGQKYRDRECKSIYTFLGLTECKERLRFRREDGRTTTRLLDGAFGCHYWNGWDILPAPYVPPFKPRIGVWRCREGSEALLCRRRPDRPGGCLQFPLQGFSHDGVLRSWTDEGRHSSGGKNPHDLIEWLRPLDEISE